MSRRLAALSLVAVLSLLLTAFAIPLIPGAAAAAPYGSRVFQANPYVVPGAPSYTVNSTNTLAQSFLVNDTYYLENVTLRVRNLGNKVNPLIVSIHPDANNFPLMTTTLASFSEITPDNLTTPVNWSWPFSPAPLLQAGRMYWIVAQSTVAGSGGYEWSTTDGLTYPDGTALLGTPSWSGLPYDLFFITFGQRFDAQVAPGLSVDRGNVQPGRFVTFTVSLNNTGAQTAPRVWANDSLPSALTNVSLAFPGIQPLSAAAFPNLVFVNVTNGPHSFTVAAQAAMDTIPGTLATSTVSVAYADQNNAVVQAGSASVTVTIGLATKQLYLAGTAGSPQRLTATAPTSGTAQTTNLQHGAAALSFVQTPALATPFHALNVTATLWLAVPNNPPETYHLTLSLLDNATIVSSLSPSFTVTASGPHAYAFPIPSAAHSFGRGHTIGLSITNLANSTDAVVVGYNSTTESARLDLVTDTYVTIQPLSLANQAGPTVVWSTQDSLIVRANVSDPFGLARVRGVWVNITTPARHLAASGPMTVIGSDSSSLPAWEVLSFSLAPPLENGPYRVDVNALEDNGVTSVEESWAPVRMPSFQLASAASPGHASTGSTVAVFLWYNNTGNGSAGWAWINNTLPSGVAFVGSSIAVTSVSGSTYTWVLTGVTVGPHELEVDVRVTGTSVNWVANAAVLQYKDTSGHSLPTLYSNATILLNGPDILLGLASSPAGVIHANETVTYTFTLANIGQEARDIWLNDTLPTGFRYVSSTENLLGGSVTGTGRHLNFTFASMPANATWQFKLVAVAGPLLARNASYSDVAVATYTSVSGSLMPLSIAQDSLLSVSPFFWPIGVRFLQGQVPPGGRIAAQLYLNNAGNEPASMAWANLTVDPRLTFVNASAPVQVGVHTLAFVLGNLAVGNHTIQMTFSVSASATDHADLLIIGTLEAHDGFGNELDTATLSPAAVFVDAAQIALTITPTNPSFEAGVASPLTVTATNSGSDTAADVWINFTLPSSFLYVNDSSAAPPAVSGPYYSWHRTNLAPGSVSIQLTLQPRPSLASGVRVSLTFSTTYTGSNGVFLTPVANSVSVLVHAPLLVLSMTASADHLVATSDLVYTLSLTNAGSSTAAVVYLADSLDPRLQMDYYNASVGATQQNGTLKWTFSGLVPGQTEVVNLTVHLAAGAAAGSLIPNAFEVTYTNSRNLVLSTVRSASVTITVDEDLALPIVAALAAVGASGAAVLLLRRRKVDIEEVFLVYRDGVLISHLSRTLMREKDEDVLSGMLTAVQEFVREAFQYGERRDLHQMDFGDYRILIERGKYVYLAIVYSGRESENLRKKVRSVIARIEHEFGTALEHWDGDMEQVIGARDLIRDTLLGSGNHNHASKAAVGNERE